MSLPHPARSLPAVLSALLLSACAPGRAAAEDPAWDTWSDTWTAVDGLGRVLPGHRQAGPPQPQRTVALFYFLWLGAHHTDGPYDLSRILAKPPAERAWGAHGKFHFWGEPLFGYYLSHDQAVMRKHAQMLADAGVDVLIADATNGFTYLDSVRMLVEVLRERQALGMRTPRLAFFANGRAARELFADAYGGGRGDGAGAVPPGLRFLWDGKPLLLVVSRDAGDLPDEMHAFFTIRKTWGLEPIDEPGEWSFLQHHPQDVGRAPGSEHPEFVSVSIAQQTGYFSDGDDDRGRSFRGGRQPPPGQTDGWGHNFSEQWLRALVAGPSFVLVTGWNEWVAQRKGEGDEARFVDTYSQEFSRDIEPMSGGHGDNYYMQLAGFVRRYKGVRPLPPVRPAQIVVDGAFDDWAAAEPEFRDDIGDPVLRDAAGWGEAGPYVNRTGRNDIVAAKVSHDADHVYFYARTREPLTPPTDLGWMMLFINADRDPRTGWLGYDVAVNRFGRQGATASLEKCPGRGYEWAAPEFVEFAHNGRELEIAVPRAMLGPGAGPAAFDFKWADNIRQTGEAADFTLSGDAAPNDRFSFRAVLSDGGADAPPPADATTR